MDTINPTSVSISLALGSAFGLLLEKGNVYLPDVIVDQMYMSRFVMLKMFLSAVSSSLASHVLLSFLAKDKFDAVRKGNLNTRTYASTAVGAGLLGLGMTISGACPGTVAAQLGAGLRTAPYVVAGCLSGALVYGLLESKLRGFVENGAKASDGDKSIDGLLGVPYWKVALPLSGLMAAVVYGLELYAPWTTEVSGALPFQPLTDGLMRTLQQAVWPPYVSGALIGMLQIPAITLLQRTLGSSTTYVVVTSHLMRLLSPSTLKNSRYLKDRSETSFRNVFQPIYLLGTVGGAALSLYLSGRAFGTIENPLVASWGQALRPFIGGYCLIFGGRLAAGCTSGHGITGFSQLSTSSFIAVPAMFGVGIAAAYAMQAMAL